MKNSRKIIAGIIGLTVCTNMLLPVSAEDIAVPAADVQISGNRRRIMGKADKY